VLAVIATAREVDLWAPKFVSEVSAVGRRPPSCSTVAHMRGPVLCQRSYSNRDRNVAVDVRTTDPSSTGYLASVNLSELPVPPDWTGTRLRPRKSNACAFASISAVNQLPRLGTLRSRYSRMFGVITPILPNAAVPCLSSVQRDLHRGNHDRRRGRPVLPEIVIESLS